MTSKKIKKLLIIMLCISVTVVIIVLLIFFINFKNQSFSNRISDWGAFGDYFGGVLNSSISFISLLILSFLTYLISKQSSQDDKENNLLMRKMDAYDKLTSYIPIINRSLSQIPKSTLLISNEKINEFSLKENKDEIYKCIRDFSEAHHFIFVFKARYGHVFNYNFDSKEFQNLIKSSSKLNEYLNSIKESFDLNEFTLTNIDDGIENFVDSIVMLVNSLRKELR